MKFFLDPGHGGHDSGAVKSLYDNGFREKDLNFAICSAIYTILYGNNKIDIQLSRFNDEFIKLQDRVTKANDCSADYFISIHCNSASNISAKGIEVFYYNRSQKGKNLANVFLKEITAGFPNRINRGLKEKNFTVLKDTEMPACLIECEFISNRDGLLFIASNIIKYAQLIAKGIINLSQT